MSISTSYAITEILHLGTTHVIYRGVRRRDGAAVILKTPRAEPAAPGDIARLRHEYEMARQLDSPWVVRVYDLEVHDGQPLLVAEDFGGEPLSRATGAPMEVRRFLDLAARLAAALADVHHQGVVHRDIKPANILVHPQTGAVKLTDLGSAWRLTRGPTPLLIEGSLPYLSPEQTGRTTLAVDHRSDLYSLGVTFYEMLTGALPFQAADPLGWAHCHIAQQPRPLRQLVPSLPEPLAGVVMKLLAKQPDERYQSAAGLRHDLERCRRAWESSGRIEAFPLGERDGSDLFTIPAKLYESSLVQECHRSVARAEQLDLLSVTKASQAISGQILLPQLQQTLMRIVLEQAGAQRALLLLADGDSLALHAVAELQGHETQVRLVAATPTPTERLPASILQVVRRTGQPVLLADATADRLYAADDYVARQKPRSVLCVPIVRQTRVAGVLYLENNLTTGAFTPATLTVLEVLAAQAAISLETARLYADLERENRQRRRAEEALRETERHLRTLVENFPDFMARFDEECRHLYVNPSVTRALGKPLEWFVGKTLHELAVPGPPGQNDTLHAAIGRAFEEGLPNALEARWPTERGERLFEVRHIPEKDEAGRVVSVLGITRDITEQKEAEEALRASEERFRAFMAHSPAAGWIVDREGRIHYTSPVYFQMFGLDEGDYTGRTVGELWEPALAQLYLESNLRMLRQQRPLETIEPARRKDGSLGEFLVVKFPITMPDGEVLVGGIALDITDRKRADEALRESHSLLNAVIEGTSDAVFVKDREGRYLMINRAGARMLGRTVAEVVGKDDRALFSPLTAHEIMDRDRRVMEAGQPQTFEEVATAAGATRTYLSTKGVLRDAQGGVVGVVGISRDVTDRKQAEEALRASMARVVQQEAALIALTRRDALPGGDTLAALRRLTEASARTLGVERVSVWRFNHDRTAIRCIDLYELPEGRHSCGTELTAAAYPCYFRALAEADVIAADDAHADPRTCEFSAGYLTPLGISSMLDAPVQLNGVLDGVVCHEHVGPPRQWTLDERAFAIAVANLVSLALEEGERWRAEEQLRASLREKEALLKEVHHRVKNNLQLISSLLSLQAARVEDPRARELLADSRNRVRSVALVHENLYRSGSFAGVPLGVQLKSLCAHLFRSYVADAAGVELETRTGDVTLDLERAVPCVLIINELVSNALKHAFPGGRAGRVTVELRPLPGGRCTLVVADDGVGLPAGLELRHTDSLGLQLVNDLAEQLHAAVSVSTRASRVSDGGTTFTITFDADWDRGQQSWQQQPSSLSRTSASSPGI